MLIDLKKKHALILESIYIFESTNRFIYDFNAFVPNASFLYPLKTSENRKGL